MGAISVKTLASGSSEDTALTQLLDQPHGGWLDLLLDLLIRGWRHGHEGRLDGGTSEDREPDHPRAMAALIVSAAMLMQVETDFSLFGYPARAMILFIGAVAGGTALAISIGRTDETSVKGRDRNCPGNR